MRYYAMMLLSVLLMVLSACAPQKDAVDIHLHSNISHANYAIESFRLQDIKLSVTFDDETSRDVTLTPSMVQNAHLNFVNQPGRHSIHVHYMGHDAIINVVLYEA